MFRINLKKTAFYSDFDFYKLFICLFILFAGSFAFSEKKDAVPQWVLSPSSVYSDKDYITYVGSASGRENAELNSLKGLVGVFGQSVKSETNASSRMLQAKSDRIVASSSSRQFFSQNVTRVIDSDDLIGVEIKEFWQDKANSTWYAIAVMNKENATDIYSTMIKKNGLALSNLKKNSEKDPYSFESFAIYDFAEDIAIENENHLKKISVINPEIVDSLKSYCPSSKKIHSAKMEIARNIPIFTEITNDEAEKFEIAFFEAMAACGFKGSYEDDCRYVLVAKIDFERSDTTDKKTVRCRYSCEGYILDTKNNHQLIPFSISGRESHIKYTEARQKAEKKLESRIKTEFTEKLSEYLKNLVVE